MAPPAGLEPSNLPRDRRASQPFLYEGVQTWRVMKESNLRPQGPQPCALSTELMTQILCWRAWHDSNVQPADS